MFSYFGAQYLTTVNLVVPEEYRSLAETIKQQIERQPRPTVNLEVLSDGDYAKRIKDGKWELTVMSMDGTDDAGIFADPDSMFHYDHTEAQQAYADARAATNDADYEARMKAYARLISEDAASDWLYTPQMLHCGVHQGLRLPDLDDQSPHAAGRVDGEVGNLQSRTGYAR